MIDQAAVGGKLLGASITERTQQLSGHGEARVASHLRQAEIRDPKLTAQVEQQIARLDVAMDNPRVMSLLKRLRRLTT